MKKIFALLLMTLVLVALPSCNEDATVNDVSYTAQLVGTWKMGNSNDKYSIEHRYTFDNGGNFVYTYESSDVESAIVRTWAVRGAWNVKKGVLQLSYDVETFRAEGFSETEVQNIRQSMLDNNQMLSDQNKKGRPFGYSIEFKMIDGHDVLVLAGANGYYERVTGV